MCILQNEKGEFPIRGVWIFRGQDIPPQMKDECYDLDLYNWEKVDSSDPKVRERIGLMLEEADKIDG